MADQLHEGHRQRLKNRFLAEGLDSFEEHEILELLLFFSIPRMDTNELAHALINRFGSLAEVLDAPYEELLKIKGVSDNTALLLKLEPNLARVYLDGRRNPVEALDNSRKLGEYFVNKFIGRTNEVVFLLCLDSSLNVINCDMIAEGTVSSSMLSGRRIMEQVVRHNAYRVVLAHNHPRGLALPSNEDIIVTRDFRHALKRLEIELIDHIIVAGKEYISLFDSYPDAVE